LSLALTKCATTGGFALLREPDAATGIASRVGRGFRHPYGMRDISWAGYPAFETLGYFRMSLRDSGAGF